MWGWGCDREELIFLWYKNVDFKYIHVWLLWKVLTRSWAGSTCPKLFKTLWYWKCCLFSSFHNIKFSVLLIITTTLKPNNTHVLVLIDASSYITIIVPSYYRLGFSDSSGIWLNLYWTNQMVHKMTTFRQGIRVKCRVCWCSWSLDSTGLQPAPAPVYSCPFQNDNMARKMKKRKKL